MKLALIVLLLLAPAAHADVSVRATLEPTQVRVGEQADFGVEVQGAQSAPVPAVPAIDGLTMRYVGPASQISIVNGAMTASVTHHFTVVATRPGTFTIGPLDVVQGGKTYRTAAVTLQALPAGAPAAGGNGPAGDQLKLSLSLGRSEAYLHERVPIELKLAVGNVRIGDLQYPIVAGDGFALEKIPENPPQTREGAFEMVTFRTVLTPLRSGTLAVGPATMHMNIIERSRRSDPFFGSIFGDNRREIDLPSEPATLTVLPLPDAGRPPDFSGAVGRFELDVQAAPVSLAAGDPVTVRSTIRGDGYLEGVAPPAIEGNAALRVYPVQPAAPAAGKAAAPGERVFEQVVIPLQPGTVAVAAPRFSYFDPAQRAYQTLTRPPLTLAVRPSADAQATPQITGAVPPKPHAETLGQDIVSIKDAPGTLRPLGARRWRSPVFWGAQALPLVAWIVGSPGTELEFAL